MSASKILFTRSKSLSHYVLKLSICVTVLLTIAISDTQLTQNNSYFNCKKDVTIFYNNKCYDCLRPAQFKGADENDEFSTCTKSLLEYRIQEIKRGLDFARSKTLRIVTAQSPPFAGINTTKDGEIFYGSMLEFVHTIAKKYKLRFVVAWSYDRNFGSFSKTNGWNGIVGEVSRKEADLGVAGLSITFDRSKAVAFTQGFHQETSAILIPAPTEHGEKITVLIGAFSSKVWICVGLTIFMLVPSLYYLHVFHYTVRNQWENQTKKSGIITSLIFYVIGSVLQNGVVSPTAKTTKLVCTIWWMLTLVLANTYLGFMTSLLSVPKLYNVVDCLEDLLVQTKIKWTFDFGTSLYTFLKSDTSVGIFKQIGNGVNDEDLIRNDDGKDRVLEGNYAYLSAKSFIEVVLHEDFSLINKCRMTVAKEEFFSRQYGVALPKNSPLMQLIDYELGITLATGLMHKWKLKHWPKNLFCTNAAEYIILTSKGPKKLNTDHIQGSLALLCLGTILAIFSLTLEIANNAFKPALQSAR